MPSTDLGLPVHFRGWKRPGKSRAKYAARFARPRARTARAELLQNVARKAAQQKSFGAPQFSPSQLPGILLRDSLPAGFIPTAVATGDLNGDGKLDFVVANGGDNNLWLYFGKGNGGGWPGLVSGFCFPFRNCGVPRSCVFCKGGHNAAGTMGSTMPSGLHRSYGAHHLHFITCSCYRRLPLLNAARARDRFLTILEQTRQRYRFVVLGYVIMPEHIHLLISEPEVGNPSTVMQVLKQRTAHALLPRKKRRDPRQRNLFGDEAEHRAFWQARFYDFNVWTSRKRVEKLRYMHRNPVKRGLVESPEQWQWSSYRFYLLGEAGPVRMNEDWTKISFRAPAA